MAYANNDGSRDHHTNGAIDEADAKIEYPQGHGDAWGHYLTALSSYYRLLRNPNFTWVPRAESVIGVNAVAGRRASGRWWTLRRR